jgi:hypothetical protein
MNTPLSVENSFERPREEIQTFAGKIAEFEDKASKRILSRLRRKWKRGG